MIGFPFNLYLLALLGGLAAAAGTFPLWRRYCERTGHVDDPGHRKIHHTPIPLAGGLSVVTGLFLPIVLGALALQFAALPLFDGTLRELLSYGLSRRGAQIAAILGGALGMVLLGWLDDRYELNPGAKFLGQAAVASLVAVSGIRITMFIDNSLVNYVLTVLWILTLINAFNFMDNMNGLCAGLGLIAAWGCAWSAAVQGQYLVALFSFQFCGALLGFLPFNFPKAQAFLGDAGSHLIGYLCAILAILPNFYSRESPHVWAVLSPLLILALPLFDMVCVMWIRWRAGKPVYIGDTNHLSHRLVRRGYSKSHAVLLIWLWNTATAAFALLILR